MKTLFAIFGFAGALFAAAPTLTELQPRGAERGKPFKLMVMGRDIPEGAQISYLSGEQEAELSNWEAEQYRQALDRETARL